MSRITSGRIKKKVGEKICLPPCIFRGSFTKDSRVYSQKSVIQSKVSQGPQSFIGVSKLHNLL